MMLQRARRLSPPQALELWPLMQLVENGAQVERLPRATLQLATDFNRFPFARKVVEQKALEYERAKRLYDH